LRQFGEILFDAHNLEGLARILRQRSGISLPDHTLPPNSRSSGFCYV